MDYIEKKERNISAWRNTVQLIKSGREGEESATHVPVNRKKVRGWRRRADELNNWGHAIQLPYLDYWNHGGKFVYEAYKAYPWYGFYGYRRPPMWFFKILLQHLLFAYDKWTQVLKERNEPYDLFIELHDSNYILSELNCKRTDEWGIRTYYWPLTEKQKPFPHGKFALKGYDINSFEWVLCEEQDIIFEEDVYWRNATVEKLLSKGYYKTETDKGEPYYAKKTGDVWIGRKINITDITPVVKRLYPIPSP